MSGTKQHRIEREGEGRNDVRQDRVARPDPGRAGLSRSSLRARLQRGNSQQLLELVTEIGSQLSVGEVRVILRNPFVTSEVIESLAIVRKLLAVYEVRSAIARHRRSPEVIALRLINGLYWRDLLEIALDVRLRPAVRRATERYLEGRLTRLTVGEKITLARRAPAAVMTHLAQDPNLRVVQALLGNPRLTEALLLPMVASDASGPKKLDLVAKDPRWSRRYEVRLALCRNPQSPFRVIFDILPGLRREDLAVISEQEAHSSIVRQRARELLSEL